MLLAIDAGNTNIVFAACDGTTIRAQWRAATHPVQSAEQYASWLAGRLQREGLSLAAFDGAILASVVPDATEALKELCRTHVKCEPRVIGEASVDLGIGINVVRPHAVGADRVVNAVAAHEKFKGALIIVDFGTATTFDVVASNGDYEGGVIAPGANLSAEALHQAAAMLPRVAIAHTPTVIGKDTIPAMQSGLYWGYVAMIEGLVVRIKAEYGGPMMVIATGGLATLFNAQVASIDYADPDLTIRGLAILHARNESAA